jgi:hypothetical protein
MDFKGVSKILNKYGEQITSAIQQKLREDDTYASGKTYNSVDYDVNGTTLDVYYSGVVNVLDEGLSPKTAYPSITSIVRWMEAKNIQPRNLKTGRFVKKTRAYMRRTAFALRSSIINKGTIKRFGYRGTGVLDFAFSKDRMNKMANELSSSFSDEINEQILLTFTSNGFTNE